MTNLLTSIAVLLPLADGKPIETTARETAWYLERLTQRRLYVLRKGSGTTPRSHVIQRTEGRREAVGR